MDIVALDIIIIVIIAASAIWGIFKGFVRQFASITALMLGIWCSFRFSESISLYLKELLSLSISQDALHAATFISIFIVTLILANLIGKGIESIVKFSMLGWLNSLLGFFFGAIKAVIILGIIAHITTYINSMFHIIPAEIFSNSSWYTFIEQFSDKIFPYLQNIFS